MAYYEGETLKARIDRGPLPIDQALEIAIQVGQGLAKAHGAGIIHRDVKPANLMLTREGMVKILDFGLAKLAGAEGITQTGTTLGTVAYMSPEQARYTLGLISGTFEWDWAEAERQFAQAVRLNPNNAIGRCWYACHCLAPTGRLAEAVGELQQALVLEPLSPLVQTFVGVGWMFRRKYEEAVKSYQAALELDPNFPLARGWLGESYCYQGKYEEAAEQLRQAQPSPPGCHWSVGVLGYCYGRWGKTEDAERLLSKLQELSDTTYIPALSFAFAHIGMNNTDLAFEWLSRAYDEQYGPLGLLPVEPIYDTLRSDPRFQALLRRMNFPQAPSH